MKKLAGDCMDKIVILDFGSQYSHLICRRIRDFAVYAELLPYGTPVDKIKELTPKGLILSGGPASVYEQGSPKPDSEIFEMNVPILGICYGHQLVVDRHGGSIKRANKEYGASKLDMQENRIFDGLGRQITAWMSHGDEAEKIPPEFKVIGSTENSATAAITLEEKSIFGLQFHPEVTHTEQGSKILENFTVNICGAKKEWTIDSFVKKTIRQISSIDGDVLCGVSGGIDSTVTALLIHKAIGNRLKCIFIDNGLLRRGESEQVQKMFVENFGVNFTLIDASKKFLEKLQGKTNPEEKRKIIGEAFIEEFSRFAKDGNFRWLAQGTLYPDVIESGISKGPAAVIKSHHNVGGLPNWLNLDLLEPLRDLYKDEVRKIAKMLDVPEYMRKRHPFPGPGLAVRIIGEVTKEKLAICKTASAIVEDELHLAGLYGDIWQAYALVGDDRAVGVVGDERRYGRIVTIRIVNSIDAMTADWTRVPHDILDKMARRITNEIEEVTWVTYAISSKPPSTIEPL
ncbi:MAG: bifunctional GMP synthase/glutamine amidotransferase protein (guaA) [Cenarchaeum symbiont of Oopsacas minuta]|nr:bifunctional GMP synthase/glutamine amidotransferase protein (guaA) [Cenarchaeum symbiont of Oopsacas minuta]